MSEQPGKAAGTAEPNEAPESINFNKPWKTSHNSVGLILDRDGKSLAHVLMLSSVKGQRSPMEIEAIALHIVACVNFCSNLDSELIAALSGGDYKITCKRIDPGLAAELADHGKQFHADQTDKPAVVLTGGAI
jgi:hypothetical protein